MPQNNHHNPTTPAPANPEELESNQQRRDTGRQFIPGWAALQPTLDGRGERKRDPAMVEAAAAVDCIIRERRVDTEGWFFWIALAVMGELWAQLWCE